MAEEPINDAAQAEIRAATSEIEASMQLRTLDALLDRVRWANQVGLTFEGRRNLYAILGYAQQITARQYRERYARGGIAKRIVEAYPKATWRGGVEIFEDEDPDKATAFENAFDELNERLHVWHALERADILAGLSTYSVILLGAPGEFDTELPKGSPQQLVYLQPYFGGGGPGPAGATWRSVATEVDATIEELDDDATSPRFGEPLYYSLRRTNITLPTEARKVHWSRVVHVAEGCLDDNVFGIPVLENVWNLLDDLDKVTGGGAEAFWLRANQGLHLDVDKDMALLPSDNTLEKLREDLEKYQHGLTRMIRTKGVTVDTLGSDVANFGPSADAILKQIAGSKGIPLRILTGSEMGQLASGQDAENWNSQVQDRRTSYAGPMIVRRLVDRLIAYGYLPKPAQYEVGWPVEEEMTEPEKADLAVKLAQANSTNGDLLFTDAEIREKTYDMKPLTDQQRKEIDDRAAEKAKVALEQQQEVMKATGGPQPGDEKKPSPFVKAASQHMHFDDGDGVATCGEMMTRWRTTSREQVTCRACRQFMAASLVDLGDAPGHEFHGNQWTHGATLVGGAKLELDTNKRGDTTYVWVKHKSGSGSNIGRVEERDGKFLAKVEDVHLGEYDSKHDAIGAVLARSNYKALEEAWEPQPGEKNPAPFVKAAEAPDDELVAILEDAIRAGNLGVVAEITGCSIIPIHKMGSASDAVLCGQKVTEQFATHDDAQVTCVKCLELLRA